MEVLVAFEDNTRVNEGQKKSYNSVSGTIRLYQIDSFYLKFTHQAKFVMKCDSIILGFNFKNTEVKFGVSALKFVVQLITKAKKM